MKTVLIFVLSANIPPYAQMMRNAMETWDSDPVEGTRTIYYHGNPEAEPSSNVISFPVDEDYKTISAKNLLAFREALSLPWDFMARVNASCYVHKARLLAAVQSLPEKGLIRGVLSEPTPCCGVQRQWMWGGGQFILSRDVVQAIVANGHRMNHEVMEDVALGELARELGYTLDGNGLCCSVNKTPEGWTIISYGGQSFTMEEFRDIPDHYFIRCKHDADRAVDLEVMKLLKQHLK
jgi:hypothetical protein